MNILSFSIILIVLIFLIKYFWTSEKREGLKLLTLFGITIGILSLFFNWIQNSCIGASTPIVIETENTTDENLEIYSITFYEDSWNVNDVYFEYELNPKETSEFCIDNDGGVLWLVAKNNKDEIKYLREITNDKDNSNYKILSNQNIDLKKAQIANRLISKKDKTESIKKFLIWTNGMFIMVLLISLIEIKKKVH